MSSFNREQDFIGRPSVGLFGEMKMELPSCRQDVLLSNRDCAIWQCRCGIYHVRIDAATWHLTAAQFERVARVFKLMLGRAAGTGASFPMPQAGLESGGNK